MTKHKQSEGGDTTNTSTDVPGLEYDRNERESVKIAANARVGVLQHKIGEVIPRPDGSMASGRLGGVNSNLEPSDTTSEEERLRATSNDGEAQMNA